MRGLLESRHDCGAEAEPTLTAEELADANAFANDKRAFEQSFMADAAGRVSGEGAEGDSIPDFVLKHIGTQGMGELLRIVAMAAHHDGAPSSLRRKAVVWIAGMSSRYATEKQSAPALEGKP